MVKLQKQLIGIYKSHQRPLEYITVSNIRKHTITSTHTHSLQMYINAEQQCCRGEAFPFFSFSASFQRLGSVTLSDSIHSYSCICLLTTMATTLQAAQPAGLRPWPHIVFLFNKPFEEFIKSSNSLCRITERQTSVVIYTLFSFFPYQQLLACHWCVIACRHTCLSATEK